MKSAGKVWVVTGAGAGMGRELALELLRRGARVAAVDVREDRLAETAAAACAGDRLSVHVADIADSAMADALVAATTSAHGVVDGLLNNAGIIQPFVPVADLESATAERVLAVNLVGPITLVRAFLPTLLARPAAHIANVSSMGGFFPFPAQTIYGASKAGLKLFSEGLHLELVDTPVRVTTIFPGAIRTDIARNSGIDAPASNRPSRVPMTNADKAARVMIDGIERDRYHVFVGPDARLMDVAVRIAPRWAALLVRRQMMRVLPPTRAGAPA